MTNQVADITDSTQALLEGLIAECHAVIRNDILPLVRSARDLDKCGYLNAVTDVMGTAVALADAVGRLRGTAPQPELRQRITVERIQRLSAPEGRGEGENG